MTDIGRFLASHRTAIWFETSENYLQNMRRVWHLLRKLSSELKWDSIPYGYAPVLSVYYGTIVNHEFTVREVGKEMVECVMVGAPKAETKTEVQHILQQSGIDRLLRVDSAPPSPEHSFFSLPLYGLLTFETFISMTPKDKRSYEPLIGIEVVHPRDEMELDLLTVLSGDDAMPILLRVIGRNLRRWIDEPKLDSSIDVNRVIQHAYELRHIGAVRAAGITAGTALELLLVKWSGLAEERVRAERTTLGRLIEKSQNLLNLSADAVTELKRFSRLRNQCAHALAEGTIEDNQLGEEVDRFLKWLTERANA